MTIKMKALRSITASQSPTGEALARGASFAAPNDAAARDFERRGAAVRIAEKPKASDAAAK